MSDFTTPELDDLLEDDEAEADDAGVQHKATAEEVDAQEETA